MIIVIDPGHGGSDPGAVGVDGLQEKDVVLSVSKMLYGMLKAAGATPVLTRDSDYDVALSQRPILANEVDGDMFVSIHCNADKPSANGIETYYNYRTEFGQRENSKRIAAIVQRQLVNDTGLKDRGIKFKLVEIQGSKLYGLDYYAVLRKSRCPAILVELGFITNQHDAALLKDASFQERAARAILKGLQQALQLADYIGHWAEASIRKAIKAGVMGGYSDGTWRPEKPVTRAELAVILDRLRVLD